MPGRDGTGPMGRGAMTGRGFGICTDANAAEYGMGFGFGRGLGCRRGFGRGFARNFQLNQTPSKTQKEMLTEQKEFLEGRLNMISKQLESL